MPQVYKGDKKEHKRLLVTAMMSPEFAVVKRSIVDDHAHHRYLAHRWRRTARLVTIGEEGEEETLRKAGDEEHSRFRKNDFPYAPNHGMGLTSGTWGTKGRIPQGRGKNDIFYAPCMQWG